MPDTLVEKSLLGLLCAMALAGCSLWLNTDERQCHDDAECVSLGLGSTCHEHVCVDVVEQSKECPGSSCPALTTDGNMQRVSPEHCSSHADCVGADKPRCLNTTCVSEELSRKWTCTPTQAISTSDVRVAFLVVDFLTGDPPKQLTVKACRNNDPACEGPLDTYTEVGGTGNVQLNVPKGFQGFFEIRSDVMDTLLYLTKPLQKSTQIRDLPVLSRSLVEGTSSLAKTTFDPTKGMVLIEALDCTDTPQGGVHLKTDTGLSFYLVNQLPNIDAKETVYDSTNNTATGGFTNVEPGFRNFDAYLGVDGLKLGSFNAQVRANTVTFIDMLF